MRIGVIEAEEKIAVLTAIKELREIVRQWRFSGHTVGFVPTMGFLHEGHKSLIRRAAAENDYVVVSIFVNPMQFGPGEDLETYPRDFETDQKSCIESGANMIFLPEISELYPDGFCSYVDMTGLTDSLCGASRPTHFRGVCTVVAKLFNIVQPDRAYFGEKDAQQLAVIRKMVLDLNMDIEIIGCPIIREHNGLAMSSRNSYLSQKERQAARCLFRSLEAAKEMIQSGERCAATIETLIRETIGKEPLAKIDYVQIVDSVSLVPVAALKAPVLCAIAVYIGHTRLIDNFTMEHFEK